MNDAHLDHDSPFSVDRIVERHNTLIVNKYGNLTARICGANFNISRSLTIEAEEIFSEGGFGTANILERYKSLRRDIDSLVDRMDENMKKGEPSRALAAVWDVLSTAQTFVQEAAPWKLKDPDELGRQDAIIQVGAEAVRVASIVLTPFLPGIATRMLNRLSVGGDKRAVSYARYGDDKSYGVGANRRGDHVVTPVTSDD
jgi:methionyl-tRNA synthetase